MNRELCERARRAIESSTVSTDSAILETRLVIRQLQDMLRISRRAIAKRSFRKLKRALRAFDRDLERPCDSAVLVSTLDALLEHFSPLLRESEIHPVRDALTSRYEAELSDFLQHDGEQSLASRFHDIERRVAGLDLHRVSRPQLQKGIRKTYRRCQDRLKKLRAEPATENSHELRRQVNHAWSQLQLIRERDTDDLDPMIAELEQLGRLLGEDVDIAGLVSTLQQHPELCASPVRSELIFALAESRRIALLSAALRLADRLFSATPGRFRKWLDARAG